MCPEYDHSHSHSQDHRMPIAVNRAGNRHRAHVQLRPRAPPQPKRTQVRIFFFVFFVESPARYGAGASGARGGGWLCRGKAERDHLVRRRYGVLPTFARLRPIGLGRRQRHDFHPASGQVSSRAVASTPPSASVACYPGQHNREPRSASCEPCPNHYYPRAGELKLVLTAEPALPAASRNP